MINKLTSFFSHQKKKEIIPLYFTEEKNESISIEITPEKTISQIYLENINQISVIKAKIFQKKPINKKNYYFTLFSSQEPNIRIKLRSTSIPWQKLIYKNMISNYSLFYIISENHYKVNQNNVQRCLNNLANNKIKNQEELNVDRQISDETHLINFVSPNNKIVDGEIEKFSFSKKVFNKIFIYIDSNKIMYKEIIGKEKLNTATQNLWNVIPLINISNLNRNCSNCFDDTDLPYIDMKKIKDKIFMITTYNNEKIIFKANNKTEKEFWYNDLNKIIERVRIDKIFYKFDKDINDVSKKMYVNIIKFLYKIIGIKGAICFKNSREFLFQNFKYGTFEKILECCIEYKKDIIKKKNFKALEQIKLLGELLEIDINEENKSFLEKNKKNNLNCILDEETYLKLVNLIKLENNNKRSSLIILDPNLINNIIENMTNKYLIKHHKRIIHKKQLPFLQSLNKIIPAQFCQNINFNSKKMNVFFKENMEIKIPPDKFPSDLDQFL